MQCFSEELTSIVSDTKLHDILKCVKCQVHGNYNRFSL